MQQRLTGRNAVVIGASRGIGRATAVALAREGARVAAVARNEDELAALVAEGAGHIVAVPGDATREDEVARIAADVRARLGEVAILVISAGVGKYGPLSSYSAADYDWMMNTNMRASFLTTQAFLPQMLARREGWVVFVGSVAGLKGLPNESIYCASKFAQMGFAQALDYETREQGVKVSVVAPGGVATTFAFGTGREPGAAYLDGMLEAEDVADAVLFAVTQPEKARVFLIGMRPMSEPL